MAKNTSNINNKQKQLRQRKKQQQQEEEKKNHKKQKSKINNNGGSSSKKKGSENLAFYISVGGVIIIIVVLVIMAIIPPDKNSPDDKTTTTRQSPRDKQQKRNLEQQEEKENSVSGSKQYTQIINEFKIIRTLQHDTNSFTQGLTFNPSNNTILYEATGMYKESQVRVLDLNNNGAVIQQYDTPGQYFGEGLSYFPSADDAGSGESGEDGRLIHLTWREKTGFIMDVNTLEVLEEFSYETTTNEGWGIIHIPASKGDDESDVEEDMFIVSDGSTYLHYWNTTSPYKQDIRPKVEVTYLTQEMAVAQKSPQSIRHVNELEYDFTTHTILANVWYQNVILRIVPTTGFVTHIYDLSALYTNREAKSDSFNGIALAANGDLWVTGKYWPFLYQIELGGGSDGD